MQKQNTKQIEPSEQQLAQVREMILSKQFDGRFQAALSEKIFPPEELSDTWVSAAIKALQFASPLSLGINATEFKKIADALMNCSGKVEINLYQFALLSNNLESRSAEDFGTCLGGYMPIIEEAFRLQQKWHELSGDLRKEVIAELTDPSKIKQAFAPPGSFKDRPAGMGAVKAEA